MPIATNKQNDMGSTSGALERGGEGAGDHAAHHNALARAVNVLNEAPLNVDDAAYAGDIAAALTVATGVDGAGVYVPATGPRSLSSPLVLTDGVRLFSDAIPSRWRSTTDAARINYTGTGSAVRVAPGASQNRESIEVSGLHFDGAGASGSVDGLFLDGSNATGDVYVEGLLFERCTFSNFPRWQVQMLGQVFDQTFRHCSFHNAARTADNLVVAITANAEAPLQLMFDDCWFAQYTSTKWCYVGSTAVASSARFLGGTIAVGANSGGIGANGIAHQGGGLDVIETHMEGIGTGIAQVAIRYSGVRGARIMPSNCELWSVGVDVGDPDNAANAANGAYIAGMVSGNGTDVRVIAGGSRRGTVIAAGGEAAGNPPAVSDLRLTTDGIAEVINLTTAPPSMGGLSMTGFNADGYLQGRENASDPAAPAANYGRLFFKDNGSGKTQLCVRFATGAVQVVATQP